MKDIAETDARAIVHTLANALNSIFIVVQLQERYITESPERICQLISNTTKDLKDEVERLEGLVEHLHQALNAQSNTIAKKGN